MGEYPSIPDGRLRSLLAYKELIQNPWGRGAKAIALFYLSEIRKVSNREIKTLLEDSGELRMRSASIRDMVGGCKKAIEASEPLAPDGWDPLIQELAESVHGVFVRPKQHPPIQRIPSGESEVLPTVCRRCNGAMIPENDWYGTYASCICCGLHVYESASTAPSELLEEANSTKEAPRRRRHPSTGKGEKRVDL